MTIQAIYQILIVKFSQTKLRWKTLEIVALQYKGKKPILGSGKSGFQMSITPLQSYVSINHTYQLVVSDFYFFNSFIGSKWFLLLKVFPFSQMVKTRGTALCLKVPTRLLLLFRKYIHSATWRGELPKVTTVQGSNGIIVRGPFPQLRSPSEANQAFQGAWSCHLGPAYNGLAERRAISSKSHLWDKPKRQHRRNRHFWKAQTQIKSLNFSTGWSLEVERRNIGVEIIRTTCKRRGLINTRLFSIHKWNYTVMIRSFQPAEYVRHFTVLCVLNYTLKKKT